MKNYFIIILFFFSIYFVHGQDSLIFKPKLILGSAGGVVENTSTGGRYDRWNFSYNFFFSIGIPIGKRWEIGSFYSTEWNHSILNENSNNGYMSEDTTIIQDYGIFSKYIFKPYHKISFYIQPSY